MGPGLLMSIAFLDPGNIAGNMEAGVKGGYSLTWLLLMATSVGLFYQTMSARIGVVTQRNLAKLAAEQYSKKTRYILWIMAELAIIGSDIQEVLGSATALYILFGMPLWIAAILTIVNSLLFLFIHYYGVRKLEAFFLFLILVMAVSYFINLTTSEPDVGKMLYGTFVPTIPERALAAGLGLVGAVIMPHNIYLHSSLVLSRKVDPKNKKQVREANAYNQIESAISIFISFTISAAIIATFAAAMAIKRQDDLPDLNLLTASESLESFFGTSAKYIWGIGLLASGQSSTMSGTYAGQFVMEGYLDIKLPIWQRVALTRSVAIVPALTICLMNEDQIIGMDITLNILQSVQLPFALIPLIKFVGCPKIMGSFALPRWQIIAASIFGLWLFAMNITIIVKESTLDSWGKIIAMAIAITFYIYFLLSAILEPTKPLRELTK